MVEQALIGRRATRDAVDPRALETELAELLARCDQDVAGRAFRITAALGTPLDSHALGVQRFVLQRALGQNRLPSAAMLLRTGAMLNRIVSRITTQKIMLIGRVKKGVRSPSLSVS